MSEKSDRSTYITDLNVVARAAQEIDQLDTGYISSASITVMRFDGEELAEVWWDHESESWLIDWMRP